MSTHLKNRISKRKVVKKRKLISADVANNLLRVLVGHARQGLSVRKVELLAHRLESLEPKRRADNSVDSEAGGGVQHPRAQSQPTGEAIAAAGEERRHDASCDERLVECHMQV